MIRENQIEDQFISKLVELKYTFRPDINDRRTLEQNFREKFERLNNVRLTDAEFYRLIEEIVNPDVFVSSRRLRERNTFIREDGMPLQYMLVNIKEWCKNEYEVIHQLRMNTRNSFQRYDVIILINGLPLVQIELKGIGLSPRRAMQQIVNYRNEPANGYLNSLLCFVQLFVVSNWNNTYYFSNNNIRHFKFNAEEQYLPIYVWADDKNKKITALDDFADAVLTKCNLGKLISRYIVLVASEQKLLIMRPYQIYAVNAIMDCIKENRGNGYIWHTTGSGKTLTSFKAATLLKDDDNIQKCIFVVDRKDLDKQTREEFNKFQDGCVEENTNTDNLVKRLLSTDYSDKIIVTTIQKLGIALSPENKSNYRERLLPLKDKRIVFIFDECHRSQFGENHRAIKEFFPEAQLFGFTGTPIFEENAVYIKKTGELGHYEKTVDVFQKELHSYTITDAIEDKNVLRFHVDYLTPVVEGYIDEKARKRAVVRAILNKHRVATGDCRFNALFATSSINDAIDYYFLFKSIQQEEAFSSADLEPLNIACVFSPPAEGNKEREQSQEDLEQERLDNEIEPDKKKRALEQIMTDYYRQYGVPCSIDEFDTYYQDVQQRMKNQKYSKSDFPHKDRIDILIVVDMLLTGFDSKFLNTLYVDKNLKYHNLIQAFSRTNRILNDTKPYGNILDFRGQQEAVNQAVVKFSGESKEEAATLWLVEPYENVRKKYEEAVIKLRDFMKQHDLEFKASEVPNIRGDEAKARFIDCFKNIQKYSTQLSQYTEHHDEEAGNALLVSDPGSEYGIKIDLMAFRRAYLDLASELKFSREKGHGEVSDVIEDIDFEFVLFASALIDYDYIMKLITRYVNSASRQYLSKEELINLLSSTSTLLDERDDIVAYIDSLDGVNGKTEEEIRDGYELFKRQRFEDRMHRIAVKHQLAIDPLRSFIDNIVDRKIFDGEKLSELISPLNLGWKDRILKESAVMDDLIPLLKRISGGQKISGLSAYEER